MINSKSFAQGDAVHHNHHFLVRRNKPEALIEKILLGKWVSLHGHSQSGKTTFMNTVLVPSLQQRGYEVLKVNFKGCLDVWNSIKRCVEDLGTTDVDEASFENFFRRKSGKKYALVCDEADDLQRADEKGRDSRSFFDALKRIKDDDCNTFTLQLFISIGLYASTDLPYKAGSSFKWGSDISYTGYYFSLQEQCALWDQLEETSGVIINARIAQEIYDLTAGHPGWTGFYGEQIRLWFCDPESDMLWTQLTLQTWRDYSTTGQFYTNIKNSSVGRTQVAVFKSEKNAALFNTCTIFLNKAAVPCKYIMSEGICDQVASLMNIGILRENIQDKDNSVSLVCDALRYLLLASYVGLTPSAPKLNLYPAGGVYDLVVLGIKYFIARNITCLDSHKQRYVKRTVVKQKTKTNASTRLFKENNLLCCEYGYQNEFVRVWNTMLSAIGLRASPEVHSSDSLKKMRLDILLHNTEYKAVIELAAFMTSTEFDNHLTKLLTKYKPQSKAQEYVLLVIQENLPDNLPVFPDDPGLEIIYITHDFAFHQAHIVSTKKRIPLTVDLVEARTKAHLSSGSNTTTSTPVITQPIRIIVDVGEIFQKEIYLSSNPMERTFSELKASILSLGTTKTNDDIELIYRKAANGAQVLIAGDAIVRALQEGDFIVVTWKKILR
eukprot:TRINITY_DN3301_c0_g4_i1.p1 TRINITY_DN3301_c0_g4~~TRINITY_DN3301_c0_g4_i1.p1  ORF type:complete len:664 (-),score=72.83 TRINITY_DN3301_c0_g4_i1:66-2057(-)